MEVSQLHDAALAQQALLQTSLITPRTQRIHRSDVIGVDRCRITGAEQQRIERGELLRQRRLLHTFGEVETQLGTVRESISRSDGIPGDAQLRHAFQAEERVLLNLSAEGVEDTAGKVTLHLQ